MLQAIKNWMVGRPGNEATSYPGCSMKINVQERHLQSFRMITVCCKYLVSFQNSPLWNANMWGEPSLFLGEHIIGKEPKFSEQKGTFYMLFIQLYTQCLVCRILTPHYVKQVSHCLCCFCCFFKSSGKAAPNYIEGFSTPFLPLTLLT